MKTKLKTHGGARKGAGRKPTMKNPKSIFVQMPESEVKELDRWAKKNDFDSRSEASRFILSAFIGDIA